MNKSRRQALESIASDIENSLSELEDIINEEQESFDNLPDSLQCSTKGDKMLDAIALMEDQHSTIEDACEALRGI